MKSSTFNNLHLQILIAFSKILSSIYFFVVPMFLTNLFKRHSAFVSLNYSMNSSNMLSSAKLKHFGKKVSGSTSATHLTFCIFHAIPDFVVNSQLNWKWFTIWPSTMLLKSMSFCLQTHLMSKQRDSLSLFSHQPFSRKALCMVGYPPRQTNTLYLVSILCFFFQRERSVMSL